MSNVILSNRYLAERHFNDTSFSRKSFSVIFFNKTTIRQNCISAKRRFDEMTFRENDVAPFFPNTLILQIFRCIFKFSLLIFPIIT